MLKPMFVFAPDTKVTSHPVKFCSGDYIAVIDEMEGTFSNPMPIGNGKTIAPTNKIQVAFVHDRAPEGR